MKRTITFILALLLLVVTTSGVSAKQTLQFSCSAQIAKAFGKSVIDEIEGKNPITVDMSITSSHTALQRLINGFSELACIAYPLPYEHRQKGYVEIPFAQDKLAVITNKSNPVDNISSTQLRKIFTGNIDNWEQLGGKDEKLITLGPNRKTASCDNFCRQIMGGHQIGYDYTTDSSTRVLQGVKDMPGSISFASYAAVEGEKELKVLDVGGVSVKNEEYPLWQSYSMVTKGEPVSEARIFINAVFSERGKEIMEQRGMKPLTPKGFNSTTKSE